MTSLDRRATAAAMQAAISVHPNPCHVGWSGGCMPWACLCKKDGGHEGRHVCICGSWTVQSGGSEEG